MSNGKTVRKDVDFLASSEAEALRKLRDAYARMMEMPDYRGYNYWAGLHGNLQGWCWHGPRPLGQSWHPSLRLDYDLWLPWHRAYLLYFEHYLRDLDEDVALPWWDWSSEHSLQVGVPEAFSAETVANQPNPLYKARMRSTDYVVPDLALEDQGTRRFPGQFVTRQLPSIRDRLLLVINSVIGNRDEDRPVSERLITAMRSIKQFEGTLGFSQTLRNIHDFIHGWTGGEKVEDGRLVGGDMGSQNTSAYDPIFWSHHCMLDRMWYLWQLENGVNNIPADHLPVVLQPFGVTVKDALNIEALGYEYAVSEVVVGGVR